MEVAELKGQSGVLIEVLTQYRQSGGSVYARARQRDVTVMHHDCKCTHARELFRASDFRGKRDGLIIETQTGDNDKGKLADGQSSTQIGR